MAGEKWTKDERVELMGEAMHAAFRKASSCQQANAIWKLIQEMPDEEWVSIVEFVDDGMAPTRIRKGARHGG